MKKIIFATLFLLSMLLSTAGAQLPGGGGGPGGSLCWKCKGLWLMTSPDCCETSVTGGWNAAQACISWSHCVSWNGPWGACSVWQCDGCQLWGSCS